MLCSTPEFPASLSRKRFTDPDRAWKTWHFAFHTVPDLPETLLAGREREYVGWFLKVKALSPDTFDDAELDHYAAAVAVDGGLRAFLASYRGAVASLVTKAGASHELLQRLLASAAEAGTAPVEVVLCEVGEQAQFLRTGRADVALMHRPVDDLAGFGTEDLCTEGQVALLPSGHPLAARPQLTLADVGNVPDLPIARWPRLDGSYPDGPGPEVHTQSQLAQLVALGKTLLVIPASSRAWQWPDHVAVPVVDAPDITTVLAWPAGHHSSPLTALARAAAGLRKTPPAAPTR
ncbi:LysR substrate-binding domain-containing protein [Streptomyces luomodiensis]|uniref:LysR substrate-binding domain-containing protein n=1 Tax=Streptomyces luomodiensis TaxID=3026192 RepID=A0ABY9VBG7_9ACTN|nr:LysR substrate-binding domain-containing protein [Streptomyces sp. SCA4-21]WNF01341.1 LysR substrate-binding domain-containing protein [Streptomyces sp. SCA4-21]